MTHQRWDAVDDYINGLLVPSDPALDAALADSDQAGLPAISVTPSQGKFLYLLARIREVRRVLEIGTLGGYSTIWLARGVASGGRVITLEAKELNAQVAETNLKRAGVFDTVEIRIGAALETLPKLAAEAVGPFDITFIDADKENNPEYFEWAVKLSRPGSVIVVDNVVRSGSVIDGDSEDPRAHASRRLHEQIAHDARVTATTLQTVGSKGHDGLLIAVVNRD